jgi:hypothetical protein
MTILVTTSLATKFFQSVRQWNLFSIAMCPRGSPSENDFLKNICPNQQKWWIKMDIDVTLDVKWVSYVHSNNLGLQRD